MKSFFKEFRDFAVKGNLIDMAIGIIIGTAFNNFLNTLVKKVVMPPLSLLTDGVNISNRKYILREAYGSSEEVAIGFGEMIEASIDFAIIAFTIFIVVKSMSSFKNRAEDPEDSEVSTPKEIELLSNIENLIKEQNKLLNNKNN